MLNHTEFDGDWYVFYDGVRFEDARTAIQAAALADRYDVALEIALRYGLAGVVCLHCVQRSCTAIHSGFDTRLDAWIISLSRRHFCDDCWINTQGVIPNVVRNALKKKS